MSYNGSIDLISGLRPKNNGSFPLMEAKDIQTREDGTRLDKEIELLKEGGTGGVKSWNDLADRPFYEETITGEITYEFDGDLSDKETVSIGEIITFIKMSDTAPTLEELATATGNIYDRTDGTTEDLTLTARDESESMGVEFYEIIGIRSEDNKEFPLAHSYPNGNTAYGMSPGLWIIYDHTRAYYTQKLTYTGTATNIKKLDAKYLPKTGGEIDPALQQTVEKHTADIAKNAGAIEALDQRVEGNEESIRDLYGKLPSGGTVSWNDLTDKPFGDESVTLGVVESTDTVKIVLGGSEYVHVKLSDDTPEPSELLGGTMITPDGQEVVIDESAIIDRRVEGGSYAPFVSLFTGVILIVYEDDYTSDDDSIVLPKKGIYMTAAWVGASLTYGSIKKLDPKFLPDDIGGSGLPPVTEADNGKFLQVVDGAIALVALQDVSKEGM